MKESNMQIKNDLKFQPLEFKPLQVVVNDHYSFEDALRTFRLKVQKEKIFSIIKEKSAYEKPSEKKRRKRREASHRRMMESINLVKTYSEEI